MFKLFSAIGNSIRNLLDAVDSYSLALKKSGDLLNTGVDALIVEVNNSIEESKSQRLIEAAE